MGESSKTEAALKLWAKGNLAPAQIAERIGSTRRGVTKILARARQAGDPRAAPRSESGT